MKKNKKTFQFYQHELKRLSAHFCNMSLKVKAVINGEDKSCTLDGLTPSSTIGDAIAAFAQKQKIRTIMYFYYNERQCAEEDTLESVGIKCAGEEITISIDSKAR